MIISYLNCYAAGIFFATCILHMLPEISEKMKNEIMKGNALKLFRTKISVCIHFGDTLCWWHWLFKMRTKILPNIPLQNWLLQVDFLLFYHLNKLWWAFVLRKMKTKRKTKKNTATNIKIMIQERQKQLILQIMAVLQWTWASLAPSLHSIWVYCDTEKRAPVISLFIEEFPLDLIGWGITWVLMLTILSSFKL